VNPVRPVVDAVDGPDPAADAIARLHDLDLEPAIAQRPRGTEPRDAGADHKDFPMVRHDRILRQTAAHPVNSFARDI